MEIISRQAWGARPPKSRSTAVRRRRVKWHWTVTCHPATASPASEAQHMRGIQSHHMDTNGWSDIAYNYVVFPSGRVYEARGLNVRSAANGGTVTNYQHQAAAAISGPTCRATQPQLDSMGELTRMFYDSDVKGHRDGHSTTCPGDQIYAWVSSGAWQELDLTEYPARYVWWRAWKCGRGPWADGKGQKDAGAKYRPRIPRRGSPKWPVWWSKFAASGGCK